MLELLDEISKAEEIWALYRAPFRYLFGFYKHEGMFEVMQKTNLECIFLPVGMSYNSYYRGENADYGNSVPSLFRQGMTEDKIFLERLKTCELGILIKEHPLYKVFREEIYIILPDGKKERICFYVDTEAIAQHYGIKTNLIDITVDKFVAAFFAVTKYVNGEFVPINPDNKDCPKYGAFYYFAEPGQKRAPDIQKRFRTVGLQPFARPGEQGAMVFEMNEEEDFGTYCKKKKFFRHDAETSRIIYNYSNRSKKLFPKDVMEDKVKLLNGLTTFSEQALCSCVRTYYSNTSSDVIKRYILDNSIKIQGGVPLHFTDNEKITIMEEWRDRGFKNMQERVLHMTLDDNQHLEQLNIEWIEKVQ